MKVIKVDFQTKSRIKSQEAFGTMAEQTIKKIRMIEAQAQYKKTRTSHLSLVEDVESNQQELSVAASLCQQVDSLDVLLQNKDYFLLNRYQNNPDLVDQSIELLVTLSRAMEKISDITELINVQLQYEANINVGIAKLEKADDDDGQEIS